MTSNRPGSDGTIEGALRDIGERIAQIRLSRNIKQADLAKEAGASLRSVRRLEAGQNTSLDTLIRVLGALGLGNLLAGSLPDPAIRPVERVTHKGHERRRARDQSKGTPAEQWTWGDEAKQ